MADTYTVKSSWKRRPSEIRGYHRTLYYNTDNGDYLRVDYNLKEKRVRLYIEIADEGGNQYYSVISNGKITAERSVSSGRSYGFADKFQSRADIFSTIPNGDVLKLINRNYSIYSGYLYDKAREEEKARQNQNKLREETRKRYFKSDANPYVQTVKTRKPVSFSFGLIDIVDILIGVMLSGIVFLYFQYSFIAMGIMASFYGIINGFIDMFLRKRSPLIIKVIVFVVSGMALYIYGYFFY
ncbi:MAG TPA: hypothetical protein PK573_15395 [Spirochaetota bacterium]|nr:hypothetical protein [Spirochaetota bacterium]HRZ27172.1 hypothetical protein [Spirochaetota bacterium]HSA15887.1 hypothetical protein [Spirochaetota bacterium]